MKTPVNCINRGSGIIVNPLLNNRAQINQNSPCQSSTRSRSLCARTSSFPPGLHENDFKKLVEKKNVYVVLAMFLYFVCVSRNRAKN